MSSDSVFIVTIVFSVLYDETFVIGDLIAFQTPDQFRGFTYDVTLTGTV